MWSVGTTCALQILPPSVEPTMIGEAALPAATQTLAEGHDNPAKWLVLACTTNCSCQF
jgi:hypothetical protein